MKNELEGGQAAPPLSLAPPAGMSSVQRRSPVVRFRVAAEEITYLRHGRQCVAVMVELPHWLPDGQATAAVAAAYRNAGYAVYSTELYGDMGLRRRSRRDFRLSELPSRN